MDQVWWFRPTIISFWSRSSIFNRKNSEIFMLIHTYCLCEDYFGTSFCLFFLLCLTVPMWYFVLLHILLKKHFYKEIKSNLAVKAITKIYIKNPVYGYFLHFWIVHPTFWPCWINHTPDCPPHKLSTGGQTVWPPSLGKSDHRGTESNTHPPDQKASALPLAPFMCVSWTILGGDNQNVWGAGRSPTKHR